MSDDAMPPPVTVLARRVVATNSKWRVRFDRIADSIGNEVEDYLVIQPIALEDGEQISGVTVVPVMDDQIVLLRNYRHPLEAHGWEAVRGFIDSGEAPVAAAMRELAEETGLQVAPESLVPLGYAMPEPSTIAGKAALFAAVSCRRGATGDRTEAGLGSWRAHSRQAVAAMLRRYEIEDATTEIALRRYLELPV